MEQCREAQGYCEQRCDLNRRACTNDMQAQAIKDYDKYAREQMSMRAQVDLHPRDFEHPEACDPAECYSDCERPYQTCYENCGGKVISTTSCRAFCF